ncbi:MAG: DUF4127 family protein [Bacillota bacterium]
MKIVYLPLDERPCNYDYPQQIAQMSSSIELLAPPRSLLGQKKTPADRAGLKVWLLEKAAHCDAVIIAAEMLLYGGLVPSRLHAQVESQLLDSVDFINQLKLINPELRIYVGSLIMRTPSYSSNDEEPPYYEQYGAHIFRYGWLLDKSDRDGLSAAEHQEMNDLKQSLPTLSIDDYVQRRQKNIVALTAIIGLVQRGVIEFMVIPQDDSALYGYTAIDQRHIVSAIAEKRLQGKIHIYPGADELGCTLLARAAQVGCAIYPFYAAGNAENIVPLFEDRPLGESLRAHLLAAGCEVVSHSGEADAVLAINAPGKFMQQAYEQAKKDVSYSSYRNLRLFIDNIRRYLDCGYPLAIADCAFANGGDTELIEMLDEALLLDKISAYAGWNTNCNTLGTVICALLFARQSGNIDTIIHFKQLRLIEDWLYQAQVRQSLLDDIAYQAKHAPCNNELQLKLKQIESGMGFHVLFPPDFAKIAATRLLQRWIKAIRHSFHNKQISKITVSHPWQRAFEIKLDIE